MEVSGQEELLRLDERSSYPQIAKALAALDPYTRLWNSMVQFDIHSENWMDGPISDLNPTDIEEEVSVNNVLVSGMLLFAYKCLNRSLVRTL